MVLYSHYEGPDQTVFALGDCEALQGVLDLTLGSPAQSHFILGVLLLKVGSLDDENHELSDSP